MHSIIKLQLIEVSSCLSSKIHVHPIAIERSKQEGVCDRCGSAIVQRDDEKEDVIRHRLEIYRESTIPLIEYYGREPVFFSVPCIDAKETVDEIKKRLHKG